MSIFLLQTAFGSALGIALAPTATDPKLVWMYTGICIATIITAGLFWFLFSHYNAAEESMNQLDDNGEVAVKASEINARGAVVGDHNHGPTDAASRRLQQEREGGFTTGADQV
ncbi:peptide transporter ptr2 [Sticta canariensis]|nr:peptide transporter ptr2 [Sticta canariensis]